MYQIDWKREPNIVELRRSYDLLTSNPTKALVELEEQANNGSIASMWYLADAYSSGRYATQDLGKAAIWYNRAEAMGWRPASYLLGRTYSLSGDFLAAFKAFSRGADENYLPSIYRLARMHQEGVGTHKNVEEASRLLQIAAAKGHLFAKRDLATLYARGTFGASKIPRGLWSLLSLISDLIIFTLKKRWNKAEYEEQILA